MFVQLLNSAPIPDEEKINNLGLFIKRQNMSRIIFLYELYKKIVNVHGSIIEFGVRWGQDLALFESFRGMLEPFNYNRKIVGFDTWRGFPSLSDKDKTDVFKVGDLEVTENYEVYLDKIMMEHENISPIPHIKKYELVKGDASRTLEKYLKDRPETIIAFAYFDMDIFEPTFDCLNLCKDRFTKGSVVAFDQLNHPDWPGELIALKEVFGLNDIKIERFPYMPTASYFIFE
jgi:hypothetical protein